MHEAPAYGADAPKVAGPARQGNELSHVAGRPSRRPAFDAVALVGPAGSCRCLARRKEPKQVLAQDERRLPVAEGGQPVLDPAPDGPLGDVAETRDLVNRVAAMDLNPKSRSFAISWRRRVHLQPQASLLQRG